MKRQTPVVYEIDSTDRIVRVNPAWSVAAAAAGVPGLQETLVVGRSLWDFVDDPTTRQLFAAMLVRARAGAPPLGFGFRCDTPAERRLMRMVIAGQPGARVSFEVTLIAVQPRPPVALLEAGTPRRGLVRMCGWCKRIPTPAGEWLEIEDAMQVLDLLDAPPLPALTHGICPHCHAAVLRTLESAPGGAAGDVTLGPLPPG